MQAMLIWWGQSPTVEAEVAEPGGFLASWKGWEDEPKQIESKYIFKIDQNQYIDTRIDDVLCG